MYIECVLLQGTIEDGNHICYGLCPQEGYNIIIIIIATFMELLCPRQCLYLLIHLMYMVMGKGTPICKSLNALILYPSPAFLLFYLHVTLRNVSLFSILCL